jgi:hypothetical protein
MGRELEEPSAFNDIADLLSNRRQRLWRGGWFWQVE